MFKEIIRFKKSLGHALNGLWYAIRKERNFQIELVISLFIIIAIFVLKMKSWQAIVLILMVMWVLITELINTVFERIVDILKPKIHPYARLVKDMMAAVVLISSFSAIIVGIIIFYPYIKEAFFR